MMIKWKHKPSGISPVQAEGYFMDHYFYFRSRYDEAYIEFAKTEYDWEENRMVAEYLLLKTKHYFKAGWISEQRATWLIYKGCLKFFIKQKLRKK